MHSSACKKISVIVPVYNVEKYLAECIESVIAQTYENWELLLIDDGSDDSSGRMCDEYAVNDERIKSVHKENGGVSSARNCGLSVCTGELVLFCDSDDWLEKDALKILSEKQEKHDADVVFADICSVRENKKITTRVFNRGFENLGKDMCEQIAIACIGYGYNPFPQKKLGLTGLGGVGNKLFKTELIKKYGLCFDSYTNEIYEDNLFTIAYLEHAGSVSYVPKTIYYYRQIQNSSVHRFRPESVETSHRIFERVDGIISGKNDCEKYEAAKRILVIRRLSEELRVYDFNKQNKKKLTQKCRELKNRLKSEPYRDAVSKVELKRLMTAHKVTCLSAKTGSGCFMWLVYVIRSVFKKILKI